MDHCFVFCFLYRRQAAAVWQWSNFLHAFAGTSRRVLHINMDETGIRLLQCPGKGLVTCLARKRKRSARGLKKPATKHESRAMFTLATLICDDEEVQKILPQIIIVGSGLITTRDEQVVASKLPSNMHLWKADKCWMTSDLMTRLIRLVRAAVNKHFPDMNIVFSADAYRAHLTKPVWMAMASARILYCLIPARMTPVLQPCDVAVFASLKRHLALKIQELEVTRPTGIVTTTDIIQTVGQLVKTIVCAKTWKKTFEDCGMVGHQRCVSTRVLEKLSLQHRVLMPRTLPTLNQLREVFPARAVIPVDAVFAGVRRMMAGENVGRTQTNSQDDVSVNSMPPLPEPWIARLRRTRARRARQPLAAHESLHCEMPAGASLSLPPAGSGSQPRDRDSDSVPVGRRLFPPRHTMPAPTSFPRPSSG